jgi:hypothetical protein
VLRVKGQPSHYAAPRLVRPCEDEADSYTYIHTDACIRTHTHACTHVEGCVGWDLQRLTPVPVPVPVPVCLCLCLCACVCVCACALACACVLVFVFVCMRGGSCCCLVRGSPWATACACLALHPSHACSTHRHMITLYVPTCTQTRGCSESRWPPHTHRHTGAHTHTHMHTRAEGTHRYRRTPRHGYAGPSHVPKPTTEAYTGNATH